MENASKALIMSASILIGIIILSIAAYLFTAFGGSSKEIQERVDSRVLAEFNNNFLKYQGSEECTIHDIVNLAKFAKKTNETLEVHSNSQYYIHVNLKGNRPKEDLTEYRNESDWVNLLSEKSVNYKVDEDGNPTADLQYYKCEVHFENTEMPNRVSGITFQKVP